MRISVDSDDPGFREDALSGKYRAYLDGKEIPRVITADEEQGYILAFEIDEEGDFVLEGIEGTVDIKRIELFGKVELRLNVTTDG